MLIIEIAAGIVLGVLLLKYWWVIPPVIFVGGLAGATIALEKHWYLRDLGFPHPIVQGVLAIWACSRVTLDVARPHAAPGDYFCFDLFGEPVVAGITDSDSLPLFAGSVEDEVGPIITRLELAYH